MSSMSSDPAAASQGLHPDDHATGGRAAPDSALPGSVAKLAPRRSRGRRWAIGVGAALVTRSASC